MSSATILHADADAFFASVEQRDAPALRGRPVIVGGGVVLAASYEAKAHGVRTAMGGRRALRLCPDAIVVPPRMAAYTEASKALYALFEDTTPSVEGLSIDEAFLDVRGMERIAGTPREIAVRLRERARERIGLPLTVGIARTKFLAKVASAVAKPDGLLVVPPERELTFLHPLPIERVWGIGPATAEKLHRPRHRHRRRPRAGPGAHAQRDARPRGRETPPCPRQQPRSTARPPAPAPPLDRVAARVRAPPCVDRPARHRARRDRRPRHAAPARGQARRPHRRPAAAFRRLHAGDPLADIAAPHGPDADRPRRGASLLAAAQPLIARRGLTLIGLTIANLDDDLPLQLCLPLDAADSGLLDAALDEIRNRYGAAAVTRGVLVGRRPELTMPLLPD